MTVTNADPNATVDFYYYSTTASGLQQASVGTTNSSGGFWTSIDSAVYNITANSSVYVTVDGAPSATLIWPYTSSTSGGTISLSESSLTVPVGQTNSVNVINNTGNTLYVSNNSNPSVANTSLSGNTLNVTAVNSGSTSITICDGNSSSCTTLNVSTQSTTSAISFSQNNVSVTEGQSTSVAIYGGTGTYTMYNNSNSSIVQASVSGATLTLYGNYSNGGTATITVCSSDISSCGSETVTVNSSNSGQTIALSQTVLTLSTGQSASITVSGGTLPYSIIEQGTTGVVSSSLNNNILTVTGINPGSTTVEVCSAAGGCTYLSVTVSGTSSTGTNTSASPVISPILSLGQTLTMNITGGNGSYYISSNPGNPFTATVSGNILTLTGVSAGSLTDNLCSSNGSCTPLYITVTSTAASTAPTVTTPTTSSKDGYVFSNPLSLGSKGNDVTELQKRLTAEGVYTGPITGYYGQLTVTAVEKYQGEHGLSQLGNVGPGTRAALNG